MPPEYPKNIQKQRLDLQIIDPCNGKCYRINHTTGDCLGCLRTREEINNWENMTIMEKQRVLKRISSG